MPVRLVTSMDRALISVEHYGDLAEHITVARQHALGLELQEFADPNVLDGDWRGLLDQYEQSLDGFTGLQRFFIGYAQGWRGITRDEAVRQQIKTDPHSPRQYRVNGVVRNIPEFYKAFAVGKKDALYLPPEDRVKIW